MDKKKISQLLLKNYNKAVDNLGKRIDAYKTLKDLNLKEIAKESIVQTNEICTELSWKTCRKLSVILEPNINISGSNTSIKHGLKTGVISDAQLSRQLIGAIQNRKLAFMVQEEEATLLVLLILI